MIGTVSRRLDGNFENVETKEDFTISHEDWAEDDYNMVTDTSETG